MIAALVLTAVPCRIYSCRHVHVCLDVYIDHCSVTLALLSHAHRAPWRAA